MKIQFDFNSSFDNDNDKSHWLFYWVLSFIEMTVLALQMIFDDVRNINVSKLSVK